MSQPGLRERKKLKTRWAIQEHALRLFAEQGYEQTTVDQIAAAAEISPSTFFRYFKTKEDVVLEDEFDPLIATVIAAAPAGYGPVAAVRHGVNAALAGLTPQDEAKLRERVELTLSVPALRNRMHESMAAQSDVMAAPIAVRLGRPADDPDVRILCGAMIGAMLPAIYAWAADGGEGSIAEAIVHALDVLDSGLTPVS